MRGLKRGTLRAMPARLPDTLHPNVIAKKGIISNHMKTARKLLSVFLALTLCAGLVTPAFAACFADLQAAIGAGLSGSEEQTENGDATTDSHANGTEIDESGRYGFGWNEMTNNWGIEAWDDESGTRNIQLNEDVKHSDSDEANTIKVTEGSVSLDLNGQSVVLNDGLKVDTDTGKVTNTDSEGNTVDPNRDQNDPKNVKWGSVIEVTGEDTTLTITDNSEDGTGTISGGYTQTKRGEGFGGGIKVDDGATLDLQGGTITNNAANNGGGVYVGEGTVTMGENAKIDGNLAAHNGGGVYLNTELASRAKDGEAKLTVNGGTISNNTASGLDANDNIVGGGGGIGAVLYAESPEPDYKGIVINGGTVTGNKAETAGAGIYVTNGKVSITDSEISNNTAAAIQGNGTGQNGGGIYAIGANTEVNVTNTEITGNTASNCGGGVLASGGTKFTMNGGEVSANEAGASGGGVYSYSGSVTVNDSTISGNTAETAGGGVYSYTADFTMNGGEVSGNESGINGGGIAGFSSSEINVNGGSIIDNTAKNVGGGIFLNSGSTATVGDGSKVYNNEAGTHSDDVYINKSTLVLVPAASMDVAGSDGKPITGWYSDGNPRYGDVYVAKDKQATGGYTGILCLKAAHDQYFNVIYTNGGETLQSSEVENGQPIPAYAGAAPVLDGYDFAGWTPSGDTQIDLEQGTVTGDLTLEPVWTAVPEPETPYVPTPVIPTPSSPDDVDILDEDVPLAGAAALNTEDHFAYMGGYPDGTIRPNGKITRAEVAAIFYRLLTEESRAIYWSQDSDFTDVAAEDWYNTAVSTLSGMEVLGGYLDGSFKPNASITRAEFAKIAVSFFDYEDIVYDGSFSDVSEDQWYAQYVAAAVELGLVKGYADGTFRPNESISRAEAAAIVNRVLGRKPHVDHLLPEAEMKTWADNADKAAWYYADIQEATNSHDYDMPEEQTAETVEQWTAKLTDQDWPAVEQAWIEAYGTPVSEIVE